MDLSKGFDANPNPNRGEEKNSKGGLGFKNNSNPNPRRHTGEINSRANPNPNPNPKSDQLWEEKKEVQTEKMKALVWFWWIDETLSANLVYQSDHEIGSTFQVVK